MQSNKVKFYNDIANFVISEIMKKYRVTFFNVTNTNILHIEYGASTPFNPMHHINLDEWIERYRSEKIKKLIKKINVTS